MAESICGFHRRFHITRMCKCLSKDVNEVIGLLAEQLRTPAFNQEEFDKLKLQRKGSLQRMLEDTNTRATEKADSMLFPVGHPNHGTSIQKLMGDIEKANKDDVLKLNLIKFHNSSPHPPPSTKKVSEKLFIVTHPLLEADFGGWWFLLWVWGGGEGFTMNSAV